MNEKGFYKKINNQILFAPTRVTNSNYELKIEDYDSNKYIPVDDWYIFETKIEAYKYFKMSIPVQQTEEELVRLKEEFFKNNISSGGIK